MAKVIWPTSPNIGDKVYASRGGAWVWDGCGWTHTCCVAPVCDIRVDGLNVCLSFLTPFDGNYFDAPLTQVLCLDYIGDDVWESGVSVGDNGSSTNFVVKFSYGKWDFSLRIGETEEIPIAYLVSTGDPLGNWEGYNVFDTPIGISSSCGCDTAVCIKFKKADNITREFHVILFPIREYTGGTPDGALIGYMLSFFSTEILIVPYNGDWYLVDKDSELVAYLPGVYPNPPVGNWTYLSYSGGSAVTAVTELGQCQ